MNDDIFSKISGEWHISPETIRHYASFFSETIRPIIKKNYLSHLVATIESMVNNKRMEKILDMAKATNNVDITQLRSLLGSKTLRLYSIVLVPVELKRRATTRYHPSGAIIYYNSCYEETTIRILIAHELGHVVNKELLENAKDSEQTANLFAYIAMEDKNKFYTEECGKFVAKSDLQILNDIASICPVS